MTPLESKALILKWTSFLYRHLFLVFFLPYALVYLTSQFFCVETKTLISIFGVLHWFQLILFTFVCGFQLKIRSATQLLFWIGISLLLIVPGAYLEFPADPWVHVQRIFAWKSTSTVCDYAHPFKFAYFFNYSFLSALKISQIRIGLNALSGFWQLVWIISIYRLARSFGWSRTWSQVQVLGVLCLFGHNVMSFRYYALSSTLLAHSAYLRFGAALITSARQRFSGLAFIAFPLAGFLFLMALNHKQELLLSILAASTLLISLPLSKHGKPIHPALRKIALGSIVFSFALSLLISIFGMKYLSKLDIEGSRQLQIFLASIFPTAAASQAYNNLVRGIALNLIHPTLIYRVWDMGSHPFQTLGLHGIIGLLFSLVLLKKRTVLSMLTLAPFCLLLFPPFVLVFTIFSLPETGYRLLYALPTSFVLVEGLRRVLGRLKFRSVTPQIRVGIAFICVALGLITQPWMRGRLWFQTHRVSPVLDFRRLDPLLEELSQNHSSHIPCLYIPDAPTRYYIKALLGLKDDPTFNQRLMKTEPLETLVSKSGLSLSGFLEKNFCGVLFFDPQNPPPYVASKVGHFSAHWINDIANAEFHYTPLLTQLGPTAEGLLWSKTVLSPHYILYEKNEPR